MPTGNGLPRTYSIAADSGIGTSDINTLMLRTEIDSDVGITTARRANSDGGWLATNNDVMDIWFVSALSGAEQTALDAVVAAHEGTPTSPDFQFWESGPISSETLETYQQKMSRTPSPLALGTYRISWHFELRIVTSGPLNSNVGARFLVDGNIKSNVNHRSIEWSAFSGWDRLVVTEGDEPVLSIEIRRDPGEGGNDTVEIRKMKLGIERMGS